MEVERLLDKYAVYQMKPKLHYRQNLYKAGQLRSIAMDVTTKCNMECAHCYAKTFENQPEIPLSTIEKLVEELYELGVFHYVLQGGEPLVEFERLLSIIAMIRPEETYVNVVSNGWLMSKEKIKLLKAAGVDKICFSIDSGVREEHDANRKIGSFDRTLQALQDVLDEGLHASLSTVITKGSPHGESFGKALKIAQRMKVRLDIQVAMPVGQWDGQTANLITTEDAAYIKSLRNNLPKTANGQYAVHRDIFTGDCDHCPAGSEFMAVTATGQVLPCNFIQYTLGTIGETPIKEMRESIMRLKWFQGKHPICLLGEDRDFVEQFVTPYVGTDKPLQACEVFKLSGGCR